MPIELSEMSLEEALRSYSSVKGHRTRVEREIGNLLRLLSATYSAPSENRLNASLEKLQTHTHRLSDIAEYLVSLKYTKARDHRDEVEDFIEVLNKCSDEVFKLQHDRHATAARDANQPQAAPAPRTAAAKLPSSELKPEKLTHDASAADFRTWKKQFRAYFDSAQLGALPCSQQQAYLCNCLDTALRARIDREATATTPVYSPVNGVQTCLIILDTTFLEAHPIHVRRKMFFDARQKEGQTASEFREELLSLLEAADGANITFNDLICMMLQLGLSDTNLQRELGAIRNPTLEAFKEKIEGYEQAKRTVSGSAHGLAVSRGAPASGKRDGGATAKNPNRNTPARNRGERDRRIALRGKCFRCAKADHMITQCSYPENVKCNLCGASGHVSPACSRRQSAQVLQPQHMLPTSPSSPDPSQLAIAYDAHTQISSDGSTPTWPLPSSASSVTSSHHRAGVFYTPANMPTPEMPL